MSAELPPPTSGERREPAGQLPIEDILAGINDHFANQPGMPDTRTGEALRPEVGPGQPPDNPETAGGRPAIEIVFPDRPATSSPLHGETPAGASATSIPTAGKPAAFSVSDPERVAPEPAPYDELDNLNPYERPLPAAPPAPPSSETGEEEPVMEWDDGLRRTVRRVFARAADSAEREETEPGAPWHTTPEHVRVSEGDPAGPPAPPTPTPPTPAPGPATGRARPAMPPRTPNSPPPHPRADRPDSSPHRGGSGRPSAPEAMPDTDTSRYSKVKWDRYWSADKGAPSLRNISKIDRARKNVSKGFGQKEVASLATYGSEGSEEQNGAYVYGPGGINLLEYVNAWSKPGSNKQDVVSQALNELAAKPSFADLSDREVREAVAQKLEEDFSFAARFANPNRPDGSDKLKELNQAVIDYQKLDDLYDEAVETYTEKRGKPYNPPYNREFFMDAVTFPGSALSPALSRVAIKLMNRASAVNPGRHEAARTTMRTVALAGWVALGATTVGRNVLQGMDMDISDVIGAIDGFFGSDGTNGLPDDSESPAPSEDQRGLGEAPREPDNEGADPEVEPREDIETEEAAAFTGELNSDTGYLEGTIYDEATKAFDQHADEYGLPEFNAIDYQQIEGYNQAHYDFIQQVLDHNGLTWDEARTDFHPGDTVNISDEIMNEFAQEVADLTGQELQNAEPAAVEQNQPTLPEPDPQENQPATPELTDEQLERLEPTFEELEAAMADMSGEQKQALFNTIWDDTDSPPPQANDIQTAEDLLAFVPLTPDGAIHPEFLKNLEDYMDEETNEGAPTALAIAAILSVLSVGAAAVVATKRARRNRPARRQSRGPRGGRHRPSRGRPPSAPRRHAPGRHRTPAGRRNAPTTRS